MRYTYTTQTAIRAAFIDYADESGIALRRTPRGRVLTQNAQPCDTRAAFVDFVDQLARNGSISDRLAQRVTL